MLNEQNPTIAVIDSGIGGVAVLKQLIDKYHSGNYIYFADNLYMPYGNKSKDWLKRRITAIVKNLQTKYNVNLIIIACNTASTCIDNYEYDDVITMRFIKGHTYFATNLTEKNLVDFDVIADKTLAKQIENNILDKTKINQIIKRHVRYHKLNVLSSFVLGCTHFELVKPIFENFCPNSKIINNSSFVINSIDIKNVSSELNVIVLTSKEDENLKEKIRKLISN